MLLIFSESADWMIFLPLYQSSIFNTEMTVTESEGEALHIEGIKDNHLRVTCPFHDLG